VAIVHGDFTRESGCLASRRLLGRRRRPTAILAASDPMALGALDAAQELGLRVPRDLSIVGFDDTPAATHVSPALTTVARPYREMGAAAVRLVLEALAATAPGRPARQVDLPTRLIVRASAAPPGGG
jgi:DNA-binding LacI/PurR family transcriptional regulator